MADCVSEKNAEKKYVSKKELVNFLAGLSGQNLVSCNNRIGIAYCYEGVGRY